MKYLRKLFLDFFSPLNVLYPFVIYDVTHVDKCQSVRSNDVSGKFNYLRGITKNCHQFVCHNIIKFFKVIRNVLVKEFEAENKYFSEQACVEDLQPLIKATSRIGDHRRSFGKKWIDRGVQYQLSGYTILCVGGRAMLYPEYRYLVESSGGNFLTFHGKQNDHIGYLYRLLTHADMVICPIDCVNNDAFYAVKHYCKYTGKPCALLDRSGMNTFRKGIEILSVGVH